MAAILTISIGYIADRTRARGICNISVSLFGAIGFSMLLGAKTAGTRYAGTFLGAMGIYPCIANTISWTSNNVEGKRPLFSKKKRKEKKKTTTTMMMIDVAQVYTSEVSHSE